MEFGIWKRDSRPKARQHVLKITLGSVMLPSLPVIAGTGFFLAGVMAEKFLPISQTPPVDFSWKPTYVELIGLYAAVTLYGASYFGAVLGPILLPLAAYQAFSLTRQAGLRSRKAIWAWTFVVLGLAATALHWSWLRFQDLTFV